jgi:hypothetical protein
MSEPEDPTEYDDTIRDTSREAYESIEDDAPTLRVKVYQLAEVRQLNGITCDEAEIVFAGRHQTISPRFTELTKAGALIDSGKRRKTRSGRNAIVWIAKKYACAICEMHPRKDGIDLCVVCDPPEGVEA